MADSSMFITIVMLVAAFDIAKAQDELGHDIEPVREYKPGIVRCGICELFLGLNMIRDIFQAIQCHSNVQLRPAQRRQRSSSALFFMTFRSRKETPMYLKVCEGGVVRESGEDEREPLLIRDRENQIYVTIC